MPSKTGKVYLVGAGPGNQDYLTLQGKELLKIAQVLIYDALIEPTLLQCCPSDCLFIEVGKRGGLPSTPQSKINQLLVTHCLQGKQVIRLKSGDPLIFGRASSEIEALEQANCPFEVVAGLSSALVAPLVAGIPLTDADLSHSFTVLSAHEPDRLDWETLSKLDTLVILMGGQTLPQIVASLIKYGRSAVLSIAIIQDCTRKTQKIWIGTLGDILKQVAGVSLSPCIIVIGQVVKARKFMSHSQVLPLAGKTVLVTRSTEQSKIFIDLLQAKGAVVLEMPALEITPPASWDGLDQAIDRLSEFDWLILTSANGVQYFLERLISLDKDIRSLAGVKIAVVGKKTAQFLQNRGVKADFIPPNFIADALVSHFPDSLEGKKILFPRVETGGRDLLVKELTSQGAEVMEVAAYQSASPKDIPPLAWQALESKQVDIITFASSKTVTNSHQLIQNRLLVEGSLHSLEAFLEGVCLASIGPETSKNCQQLFGRVDLEAQEYTLEGLADAIVIQNERLS